ncbi:MAG: M55 family metallopeptidase [Fusicatenibacter sp.]|nr:M55 family metallopeptidase [Lachnospiraceae bacterium]MDY2937636.1 M55 family metallopeptidase [Fusicatenibacter sp.]
MNIYVMVDIEGISGIYTREQVLPYEGMRFAEGRRYMTDEVNVCVSTLKSAGADKVYVYDCHGNSSTVIWEELTKEADYYICGSHDGGRMPGLEECDAVVLLGYHAMAGTKGAVLEHTFSSMGIQNLYLNGEKVGEIGIDAAIAGEKGKKVLLVSGDDKACAEAKRLLPDVVTCEVKRGMNSYGAMMLPREKAHQLLSEKIVMAMKNASKVKPLQVNKPVVIRAEQVERTALPNPLKVNGLEILDGRSFQVTADTVEEAFYKVF